MRTYNSTKKKNAITRAEKNKGQSVTQWIENTMRKKFEDVPIQKTLSLREKASAVAVHNESKSEVEILQKIIIRENLINELKKLMKYNLDVDGIISELNELIKGIRNQTLDIIEDIYQWKVAYPSPRKFLYRGENYLLKTYSDMSFLDEYDDVGNYYGYYFHGNPLMFPGKNLQG